MDDRATARNVGWLFIIGTATAIIGGTMLLPIEEADALGEVAMSDLLLGAGLVLELVLVVAVVGMATLLFPVLRRDHEGAAASYVGARVIEGVFLLAATVSAMMFLALSDGATDLTGAELAAVGELTLVAREWTYFAGSMLAFGVSAVILNYVFHRTKLVPDWLSIWGLAGAFLLLVRAVAQLYGMELQVVLQVVLTAPIALQEMVLAVRLIAHGFDTPATTGAVQVDRMDSPTD